MKFIAEMSARGAVIMSGNGCDWLGFGLFFVIGAYEPCLIRSGRMEWIGGASFAAAAFQAARRW